MILNSTSKKSGSAFTLVEMLVAMAVTLLMMAALARAFGFVGESVRDSRANVELASRLGDITTRLSEDLKRCTVNLTPASPGTEPLGYFLCAEGPVTDVTSSLFRAFDDSARGLTLDDARYGDFDDYLAFTAVAEGDRWFTGKVPRFILDQKTAEESAIPYNPANYPGGVDGALDPIVIRSKYAEIIYFASPDYNRALPPNGDDSLPATPTFFDGDANNLPDRINLHRRVLLIRPDLNVAASFSMQPHDGVPSQHFGKDSSGDLEWNPTNGGVHWLRADDWPTGSSLTNTGSASSDFTISEAWLFGMAGAHQQCDLSLRRVFNSNGTYTTQVAANSLEDLSKPHNRFAHICVPASQLGRNGPFPTSMPILALGDWPAVLEATTTGSPLLAPPLTPTTEPVVTPSRWSGFLRPEFVLGLDRTHREFLNDSWGSERQGEDLLTNNALSLDVQIFDPEATFFTTNNNLVVGPNDAGYREAIIGHANATQTSQGGFVDIAYPVLAGGSLRGWQSRLLDRRSTNGSPQVPTANGYLNTPFSGVTENGSNYERNRFFLQRSGRLYVDPAGQTRLFQPAFDTFTMHYETDGMEQDDGPVSYTHLTLPTTPYV